MAKLARVVLWMIGALFSFSTMAVSIREPSRGGLTIFERLTPSRVGVVLLGLVGVLVILRPGIAGFNPAALLVPMAAFGYAITMITTKQLTMTEITFGIIFWKAVIRLPLSLIGSDPAVFLQLQPHHLLPALAVGIAGLTSHYCLSNAFRAGDAWSYRSTSCGFR